MILASSFAFGNPLGVSTRSATPDLPFRFTYLFSAHLNLGSPAKPIPIPGGVRTVEPILNGTVSGPGINATLGYSLATPTLVNNGTTQKPVINAVGMTDDGFPLYIYETGVGSLSKQVTRIVSSETFPEAIQILEINH